MSHTIQAQLPSAKYLGHNLYASTFELFEQRLEEQRLKELAPSEPSSGYVKATTDDSIMNNGAAAAPSDTPATPAGAGAGAPGTAVSSSALHATNASDAELSFLAAWRLHGAPAVVISYVSPKATSGGAGAATRVGDDALATLRHELCHARFALLPAYKQAVEDAWAGPLGKAKLEKWLGALVRGPCSLLKGFK